MVLSNDSFQEFQDEYPWLFDVGRLIGGKPVRGVGWVFTPRMPVRNVKSHAHGEEAGGDARRRREADDRHDADARQGEEGLDEESRQGRKAGREGREKSRRKAPRSRSRSREGREESGEEVAKARGRKKAPAKKARRPPRRRRRRATRRRAARRRAVALKRGRQPVNPEADFALFRSAYRVGSTRPGEVTAFTSHGAVIKVALKGDKTVECYAPDDVAGRSAAGARA